MDLFPYFTDHPVSPCTTCVTGAFVGRPIVAYPFSEITLYITCIPAPSLIKFNLYFSIGNLIDIGVPGFVGQEQYTFNITQNNTTISQDCSTFLMEYDSVLGAPTSNGGFNQFPINCMCNTGDTVKIKITGS